MKQDDFEKIYLLTESFIDEVEKNKLDEGFSDTAKAKWAGIKGSIKGLGKQIQGGVNKATGSVLDKGISYVSKGLGGDPNKSPWAQSARNLAKKGQSQIDVGKNLGYSEKYNTYISSVVDSIVNDLKDLNINIGDKNKLVSDIKKSITTNTTTPQKNTQKQTQLSTTKQSLAKPQPTKKQSETEKTTTKQTTVQSQTSTTKQGTTQPKTTSTQKQKDKILGNKGIDGTKNYAGQWLSPTERISLLGVQGGKMKVDPNDPSQVENPFSPRYKENLTQKSQENTSKSKTINEPKRETNPKKEQAKNIVSSKMKK